MKALISWMAVGVWFRFFTLCIVAKLVLASTGFPCKIKTNLCGCVFTDTYNGDKDMEISLRKLNNDNGQPWFSNILGADGFKYYLNLCTGFNFPEEKKGLKSYCSDATGCRVSANGKDISTIAKPGIQYFGDYSPDSRLTATYGKTSDGSQMILNLECRKDVEGLVNRIIDSSLRKYYIDIISKHACPQPYVRPNPTGNTGDNGQGLSIGSFILITFFSAILLYFILGTLLNLRKGLSGLDIVPHVAFWASLPGLIKDGCLFSGHKLNQLFCDACP